MTEQEIQALQEAKDTAERRAAEAEAAVQTALAEANKAKEDITKIVDELKEERQKKNEALSKANINSGTPDVNALIEQALAAKDGERRKAELEEAIAEFKSSKTEFQADAAGLVFDKFKTELKKFNFSDVTNKAQAKARLEEAYRFVNGNSTPSNGTDYEGTTRSSGIPADRDGQLSKETDSALELARMNKETFTALKTKYGEAMTGLGIN